MWLHSSSEWNYEWLVLQRVDRTLPLQQLFQTSYNTTKRSKKQIKTNKIREDDIFFCFFGLYSGVQKRFFFFAAFGETKNSKTGTKLLWGNHNTTNCTHRTTTRDTVCALQQYSCTTSRNPPQLTIHTDGTTQRSRTTTKAHLFLPAVAVQQLQKRPKEEVRVRLVSSFKFSFLYWSLENYLSLLLPRIKNQSSSTLLLSLVWRTPLVDVRVCAGRRFFENEGGDMRLSHSVR